MKFSSRGFPPRGRWKHKGTQPGKPPPGSVGPKNSAQGCSSNVGPDSGLNSQFSLSDLSDFKDFSLPLKRHFVVFLPPRGSDALTWSIMGDCFVMVRSMRREEGGAGWADLVTHTGPLLDFLPTILDDSGTKIHSATSRIDLAWF